MSQPITAESVRQSVFRAIGAHNETEGQSIPLREETVLLGEDGAVDSLGLVRLIMTVERQVEDDFGRSVSLTDDKAMSQRSSPFRTVASLVAYIAASIATPG